MLLIFTISLLKSSKSSGTRLVTMLLSTTTDSSTTSAFDKSLRTLITPVIVRPFKSSVSTNTNGP